MAKITKISAKWEPDYDYCNDDLGSYVSDVGSARYVVDRRAGTLIDTTERNEDGDYKVMRDDLPRSIDRNTFEYWVSTNYSGTDDANAEFTVQDYLRAEGLNNGAWGYETCVVTAKYVFESELGPRSGSDSVACTGTESDCGEDYKREVEAVLVADLLARLAKEGITCDAEVLRI